MVDVYLSGGGDDIYRILNSLAETGVFQGVRVGYVAIAAETMPALYRAIHVGFSKLSAHFVQLGAREVRHITSAHLPELEACDVVVLSGGDTAHLIDVLKHHSFRETVARGRFTALIGISAGALALATEGLGTKGGQPHWYKGLGIVDVCIVPHSNAAKKAAFPEATHLDEYTFLPAPSKK